MITALRMPGVASLWFEPDTGPQRWLLADDGSWACVDHSRQTVTQHGARCLWDDVESLYERWANAGKPTRERFGLTVTDAGVHWYWLDSANDTWWTDSAG